MNKVGGRVPLSSGSRRQVARVGVILGPSLNRLRVKLFIFILGSRFIWIIDSLIIINLKSCMREFWIAFLARFRHFSPR